MLIRIPKKSDVPSSEITPESVYVDRRRFLGTSAALTAAAALTPKRALGAVMGKAPGRQEQLGPVDYGEGLRGELNSYEDITTYNNFYEFGTGKTDPSRNSGDFQPEPWSVEVTGECLNPGTYGVEDLIRPDEVEDRIYRLRCVEAWSMVIPWRGVPLRNIISRMEPTANARFVAFETVVRPDEMPGQRGWGAGIDWPYVEGFRIDEAANYLTLMVSGMYGRDLLNQNGAPLRLITPWKYGFKSIKSIVKISFVEQMPPTSWNKLIPQEYGFYANVNPEVDHPRWTQARERRIGELRRRETLMFNGYTEEVGHLYAGMDLRRWY